MTVPHFVYLATGDNEETIWAQMLVVVVLAAGAGIYMFVKTRPGSRRGKMRQAATSHGIINGGITHVTHFLQTIGRQIPSTQPTLQQKSGGYLIINQTPKINYQAPSVIEAVIQPDTQRNKKPASDTQHSSVLVSNTQRSVGSVSAAKRRNLKNGMELLEGSFLVKIIEQPIDTSGLDIEMQKMCFAELMRRSELAMVSSEALKVYTIDEKSLYGKIIRFQAMEELFRRTGEKDS